MFPNPVSSVSNVLAEAARLGENAGQPLLVRAATRALLAGRTRAVQVGVPVRTAMATAHAAVRAGTVRRGRSSGAGYAKAGSAAAKGSARSSSSASANDPLAFLKDSKLSIEEKLMKLLGYMNQKWEKEMQKKLDAIAAGEAGQKRASGSKKSGGLLGSLGGGVSGLLKSVIAPAASVLGDSLLGGVLKQVGGPVLAAGATALGFPQLAPVLLKYGPEIASAVTSVASSLSGGEPDAVQGGGASGGSSGGSTSTGGSSKAMSDSERQTILLEIQRIQQKQQEMFSLVSNLVKSNHDIRLSVLNNIR